MQIDINADAMVRYTAKLERLRRSALPIAVRTTLNSAAFDVKQRSMPASAKGTFVQRRPTFFKANSKVKPAKGFDMKTMKSVAGFIPKSGQLDKAIDELEQQEAGGAIGGRSFISMRTARVSKSDRKIVRKGNRISDIANKVVDAEKVNTTNKKQRYIRAAFMAAKLYGHEGYVLGNNRGGKRTLSRIDEIWGSTGRQGQSSSRALWIKRTPLYTYQKGRKVRVRATNFMKRAVHETGLLIPKFFKAAAEKQIEKTVR